MKFFLISLAFLFSMQLSFAQEHGCFLQTSSTNFSRWDIERLLEKRPFTICVDSNKFSRWDLEQLLEKKAHLRIYLGEVDSLSRWDLEQLADKGFVSIYLNTNLYTKLSRWDVEQLLKNKATVFLKDDANLFSRWELEQLIKVKSRLKITIKSSQSKFSRWDLEQLGKASQESDGLVKVILVLDSDRFSVWDIEQMIDSGILIGRLL